MGRSHRIDIEGGIHHVMNRGADRQTVFFCDADRVEFGRLLGVVYERFGVQILAYCLLGNHYHLLLSCPDGGLSDAMHLIGSVFTRHANDRVGRDGPLFRGRFHAVPVLDDDQLLVTTRYIHRNALDIAGIDDVSEYRWSSHRAYLGLRRVPEFLDVQRVLGFFGGSVAAFDDFVQSDLSGCSVLPPATRCAPLLNLAADAAFGVDGVAPNVARTVAILTLGRLDEAGRAAMTQQLGFANVDAEKRAIRRARQRLACDSRLDRAVTEMLSLMGGHVVPGTT